MSLSWSDTVEEIAEALEDYRDADAREVLEASERIGRLRRALVDDVLQKLADWDAQPHVLRCREALKSRTADAEE